MTFEGSSDETDVESQVNTLDAVIAENPDVVCVSAGDSESCQAQLESARDNGIPVVTFDSDVSSEDLVSAYCGTDNQKLGDIAAKRMAHYLSNHGTVAVFSPQEKTLSSKSRVEAFQESIADYPGIEVVQVIYSDQVDDMEAAIKGVLEIYPKLDGIFCTNGDISDLCLSLVQDADRDSIIFIGTDATSAQQDAIRDGAEVGTLSQKPYEIGYQTILAALQTTTEDSFSSKQTTLFDPAWIDTTALDDPYYTDYIYE